jgi:hypothetical protein
MKIRIVLLVAASVIFAASVHADPVTMPLLGDSEVHLYAHPAFSPFNPKITAAVEARFDELIGVGMDTCRYIPDWRDLEPSPGRYTPEELYADMENRASRGIKNHVVNICVVDAGDFNAPQYILDMIEAGKSWDDPKITTAFNKMLSATVPGMIQRGLCLLGLSNEPVEEGAEAPGLPCFIESAIKHVHAKIHHDLSCTIAFAGPKDPSIPKLLHLCDVATFNCYLVVPKFDSACTWGEGIPVSLAQAAPPEAIGALFDELIEAAQGKLINIQEMGQATGFAGKPTSLGPLAGPENQAACYEAVKRALHTRKAHFRTVCNWSLNDHSEGTYDFLRKPLRDAGCPDCFIDNAIESWISTGLVLSDETATKKPAFDVFKEAVAFLSAEGKDTGDEEPDAAR